MSRSGLRILVLAGMLSLSGAEAYSAVGKDELAYRVGIGRADDIKLLISKGANPNGADAQGLPLLLVAAGRKDDGALPAVQALLENGADVNAKDKNGQTALYYAARTGRLDVVDYLLKKKIDYYSTDNNGDIARTIAFRSGHKNVVERMDAFVKEQTLQLEKTLENANAQQRSMDEQSAAELERQEREAAEAAVRQEEERKKEEALYEIKLVRMKGLVFDLSYNACAFQYWSYALAANQTMQFPDEQVEEIIDIHRYDVEKASLAVMDLFSVDQNYVNRVIVPSKQLIYEQLNAMPSRTYRREHGVGTLKDVDERCRRIAGNWDVAAPARPAPVASPPPVAAEKLPAVSGKAASATSPVQVGGQAPGTGEFTFPASPNVQPPATKPYPNQTIIQQVGPGAATVGGGMKPQPSVSQ